MSEEDEIAKIKRQNKSGASSSETAPAATAATPTVPEAREPPAREPPARPAADRVASLKKAGEDRRRGSSHEVSTCKTNMEQLEVKKWTRNINTPHANVVAVF